MEWKLCDESCLLYFDDYKFREIIFILNRGQRKFSMRNFIV